jgi:hypothetical protein
LSVLIKSSFVRPGRILSGRRNGFLRERGSDRLLRERGRDRRGATNHFVDVMLVVDGDAEETVFSGVALKSSTWVEV